MEPLHVTEFGVFVGKHSERVVLRKGGEKIAEHPLLPVEQILGSGRAVSIRMQSKARLEESDE